MRTRCFSLLLLLLLLLLSPQPATALNFPQYKTLISLSRSLLSRVADARDSRGDLAGAARARAIAGKLRLLGGGRDLYAVAWDFVWRYGFRGGLLTAETYGIGAELLEAVGEVSGLDSGADRARWVIRNYERVIGVADALLRSLLRVFSKSGPLREAILVLEREVVEGELLKDLIEVGAKDLDGLIYLVKEMFSPVGPADSEL